VGHTAVGIAIEVVGKDERRKDVAILKSSPTPPKNATLQIRFEEEIRAKLHKYAEFIISRNSLKRWSRGPDLNRGPADYESASSAPSPSF